MKISITCVITFALLLTLPTYSRTIEEDWKEYGSMDGHPVKVFELLKTLNLPDDTIASCEAVAIQAQNDYRAWYKVRKDEVESFIKRIQTLKKSDDRKALRTVQLEKKKLMHTAPSLLRHPEPLQAVLTAQEYTMATNRLQQLRIDLHTPGKKRNE